MARRSHEDTEKTRNAILRAAEACFAEHGYAGTSLSDIAGRAGVTKSLIHHHFHAKDALWQRVRATYFQAFLQRHLESTRIEETLRDFVSNGARAYFNLLRENPTLLHLLWWSQAEHGATVLDPEVQSSTQALLYEATRQLRRFQERGELRRDLDPKLLYAAFVGVIRHWFVARHDYGLGDDAAVDELYIDTIVTLFLDGLTP